MDVYAHYAFEAFLIVVIAMQYIWQRKFAGDLDDLEARIDNLVALLNHASNHADDPRR